MEPRAPEAGVGAAQLLLRCHQIEKELAAGAGLSVDEFHLISQLFICEPCCVKTLREMLALEPTRLSRILNTLEGRGFLTRSLDDTDKRRERLALTEEGRKVARSIFHSSALSMRHLPNLHLDEAALHTVHAKVP